MDSTWMPFLIVYGKICDYMLFTYGCALLLYGYINIHLRTFEITLSKRQKRALVSILFVFLYSVGFYAYISYLVLPKLIPSQL